jgi:predicted nuclease with TOPRIM domain
MVFYETFKHKFDVKKVETERLLTRVEELSQLNGGLEDQIERQKGKSGRLQHDIDDLKDKIMLLKNSNSGPSLAAEKALSKVDQFK